MILHEAGLTFCSKGIRRGGCLRYLINAIVAAAAFAGLVGGFEDQERGEDAVAQADDGIADFAFS